ncbi:MAG TPA: FKBP-type peptidyl-prolyl cis-trans isomerase [Gammaproteobacteria bacterium]|nr:FKBP-type peptidyl-prolyl cis-trans isomerase [Gammaproteobacteria bacterium]
MKRILFIFAIGIFSVTAACGAKKTVSAPADVAAPPADAMTLPSGLAYKVLKPGSGHVHPKPTDIVTVDYTGWTTDGKMFDSSVTRGEPATFPLNHLIKGWQEGIPLMVVGEKARFWIPANLAYGKNPRPGAPKGMLVFDITLHAIKPAQ